VPQRRVWVTFDTPQSRSLLADREVHFARFVGPRDLRAVLMNLRLAGRLLRHYDVRALVSTGSGLALSFFGPARLVGVPCHYVESAARTDGPSLTGRIVSRLPRVRLYTQYRHWSDKRWRYRGAVIDDVRSSERTPRSRPLRVAVTLGTIPYSFDRLTRRLASILPRDAEVYWQTGSTDPEGLPGTASRTVPHAELVEAMREADVVVAHAGVGSALDALDVGRPPVLVFREAQHGEHVDDHQRQIADLLGERGVAFPVSAEDLTLDDLERAARLEVRWGGTPSTFPLD
jgi:UDP-N-acetylglucosamine--N-acetylmuramyl-(pentapeptide) pyrophosphoryl-undecaprenol N-acetylglucosamine transferase